MARDIWRIIGEIRTTGMATVIVDKNFSAVSSIADRAMILVKGGVVYDGSAAELRADKALHVKYLGV